MRITLLFVVIFITFSCNALAPREGRLTSLTPSGDPTKKIFFGFGDPNSGRVGSEQFNEPRFDLRHLQNIFGHIYGGNYRTKLIFDADHFTHDAILKKMDEINQELGDAGMYAQYSATHGFPEDLKNGLPGTLHVPPAGISHIEMRDKILSFKAKEILVFTMACYSGGLVEAFKKNEAEWRPLFEKQKRTLFIMSSSKANEVSDTGPGQDINDPYNIVGDGGSLFGYYVWRGLTGLADTGHDGYITLGELRDYVTSNVSKAAAARDPAHRSMTGFAPDITKQTPQSLGVFDPDLRIALPGSQLSANPGWITAKKNFDAVAVPMEEKISELLAAKDTKFFPSILDAWKLYSDLRTQVLNQLPDSLKQKRAVLENDLYDGSPKTYAATDVSNKTFADDCLLWISPPTPGRLANLSKLAAKCEELKKQTMDEENAVPKTLANQVSDARSKLVVAEDELTQALATVSELRAKLDSLVTDLEKQLDHYLRLDQSDTQRESH